MTERLHRLERLFQRSPIYFVTTCTAGRNRTLDNSAVHARVIEFGKAGDGRGAWLGSYVLMPDHIHAFVVIDDERLTLSGWVKSLKNALSKTLRAKCVIGTHWQKGFFDHALRGGESYSAKWDYVRENPVRAGYVEEWSDWEFLGEIFALEFKDDRL